MPLALRSTPFSRKQRQEANQHRKAQMGEDRRSKLAYLKEAKHYQVRATRAFLVRQRIRRLLIAKRVR